MALVQSDVVLVQQLHELEESLLDPGVRKSERVPQLLAEDFVELGRSGRANTRSEVVEALRAESSVTITVSEFAVRPLAPDTALVTYLACRRGEPPRYEPPRYEPPRYEPPRYEPPRHESQHCGSPVCTRRSSVWQRRQRQWQMVFHKGTVAKVSTPGRPASR